MPVKQSSEFEQRFRKKYDIPEWFRGISISQMQAAEKLQNALRDDSDQGTAHRVVKCMEAIGLKPLVETPLLRQIIQFSQNNDLAFLYGLLTLHYKKINKEKNYTLNEQLIMSSICHLDMIATLRELDRILPKGHPPKKVLEARKAAELLKKKHEECIAKRTAMRKKNPISPYFEKLAFPICREKKDFSSSAKLTTSVYPYEAYKDPHYIVPNHQRWFANYKLKPVKRIVGEIIMNEFGKIFNDYETVHEKAENNDIFCLKHYEQYFQEWREREEKKLTQKFKNFSLLKEPTLQRKLRREQLIERLDHDIEFYRHKLRKDYKEKNYHVTIVRDDDRLEQKTIPVRRSEPYVRVIEGDHAPYTPPSSATDIPKYMLKPKKFQQVIKSSSKCVNVKQSHNCAACSSISRDYLSSGGKQGVWKASPRILCGCNENNVIDTKICSKHYQVTRNSLKPCASKKQSEFRMPAISEEKSEVSSVERLAGGFEGNIFEPCKVVPAKKCSQHSKPAKTPTYCSLKQKPAQGQKATLPKPNKNKKAANKDTENAFFKAATNRVPYKFEYERVFRFDAPVNKQRHIQECIFKSLDDSKTLPKEKDGHPNVINAAEKCFRDMYKKGVREKTAQMKKDEALEEARINAGVYNLPENVMARKYPQKLFDPDDKALMDNMLKDAFELMQKDPYFVLATFPDAYKLPLLREWIYKRYGKRYTDKDRLKLVHEAEDSFRLLTHQNAAFKVPYCEPLKVTKGVKAKLAKQQESIWQSLNEYIMRISREFWFTLSPYTLPYGPPLNTYFAYMPPRVQNILNFNLWKPYEFKAFTTLRKGPFAK